MKAIEFSRFRTNSYQKIKIVLQIDVALVAYSKRPNFKTNYKHEWNEGNQVFIQGLKT